MGEPEEDGPNEDASASVAISASEVKRNNDATMALSESEFLALQVPAAAPPAIPAGKPARAASPVARNDASMWAGSVLVADEFEPLVVPKKPLGRWVLLAFFTFGLAAAALYFLWWQPAQETDAEVSAAAAKAAEPDQPAPTAAPAPAPAPDPALAAQPLPAQPASVAAPEKPAATPTPNKTASKKKSSKKKASSKKKTSSKKKKKKKRSTRRGG